MGPVAEGLARTGWTVEGRESERYPQGDEDRADMLAIWGDHFGSEKILRNVGKGRWKLLQVDNGYTDRRRYEGHYSLSYGARQCHAYLWTAPFSPGRFALLREAIQPWRKDGTTILLLAPSIKQGKFLGFDSNTWARQMVNQIAAHTKKRILVSVKQFHETTPLRDILAKELIHAAVGYNTKGLVDCLLYGIPVFNVAPCVTERMGLQDLSKIEAPYYPENRQEFFERLAHHQFLLSEIAEGLPFRAGVMPL